MVMVIVMVLSSCMGMGMGIWAWAYGHGHMGVAMGMGMGIDGTQHSRAPLWLHSQIVHAASVDGMWQLVARVRLHVGPLVPHQAPMGSLSGIMSVCRISARSSRISCV